MVRPAPRGVSRAATICALAAPLALAIGVALLVARRGPATETVAPVVAARPATRPTTRPAEVPPSPPPPRSYLDVVRADYPALPATRPFDAAVDLADAARIVLTDPVYLGPSGHLWITRAGADPAAPVLRAAREDRRATTHVLADRVAYCHWAPDPAGGYGPTLIVAADRPAGNATEGEPSDGGSGYDWITPTGRRPLPTSRPFDFSRAYSWGDRVVVPTAGGCSVLAVEGNRVRDDHWQGAADVSPVDGPPVDAPPADAPPPTRMANADGFASLLAWVPADPDGRGGHVARYRDGEWHDLTTADGLAARPVHLVPLLDGSLLQVTRDDGPDRLGLAVALLDKSDPSGESKPAVDEVRVTDLVRRLSDPRPANRDAAYAELTRFGPSIWPLLERLGEKQPPEAKFRIRTLLADKTRPTLGGMTPADGPWRVVSWLDDGGVVLWLENGVTVPRRLGGADAVAPAWVSIRPGQAIGLLAPSLTDGVSPDRADFAVWGDETVLTADDGGVGEADGGAVDSAALGPQRFYGNHRAPLLTGKDRRFTRFVGIDAEGRWLFRPADPAVSGPTTRTAAVPPTLVLDPRLPDPTPRLPVWAIDMKGGKVGRSGDGWPTIERGGAWELQQAGWSPVPDDRTDAIEFAPKPGDAPPPVEPPTSQPATQPTSQPVSRPADPPLLTDADGTRYYGGVDALRVVRPDGSDRTYPLPPDAAGDPAAPDPYPALFHSGERLYLMNVPGRIARLRLGDGALEVEATFTDGVPTRDVSAAWLDPADRLVIAHGGDRLAVLFPTGAIPPDIRQLMPATAD